MKKILVVQTFLAILSSVAFAGPSAPTPPTNSCNSYDQINQYGGYVQCILNFNNQVVTFHNQVNQYNQIARSQGSPMISPPAGLVATPNMPQNNCGQSPSINEAAAWQTYNQCVTQYNSNKQIYESAMVAVNNINQQFMAQLEAAQAAEAQRLAQIQANNQTSTTGTLQQVQQNTKGASKIYSVAAAVLAGYGTYKALESTQWFAQCTPYTASACMMGAIAAGASVYFFSQQKKANGQVATFADSNVKVCQANNAVSNTQNNCNATDPSSPIYDPGVSTPVDASWYDPGTGQCKADAPQLCKDMMNGENGYQAMGNSLPKVSGSCAGAAGTACMAAFNQMVTQTPRGPKVTFKDKTGKEYTYYPDELRDEKSLMAAGLSSAQAKKALAEMAAAEENAKKALADAKKAGEGLEKMDFGGLGSGSIASGTSGLDGFANDPNKRKFKDDLKAVEGKRKPSSAGLVKDFHGDMIGAAGDDIFTMMNRRYQLKNDQDSFFP